MCLLLALAGCVDAPAAPSGRDSAHHQSLSTEPFVSEDLFRVHRRADGIVQRIERDQSGPWAQHSAPPRLAMRSLPGVTNGLRIAAADGRRIDITQRVNGDLFVAVHNPNGSVHASYEVPAGVLQQLRGKPGSSLSGDFFCAADDEECLMEQTCNGDAGCEAAYQSGGPCFWLGAQAALAAAATFAAAGAATAAEAAAVAAFFAAIADPVLWPAYFAAEGVSNAAAAVAVVAAAYSLTASAALAACLYP